MISSPPSDKPRYHHGNLAAALIDAGRDIVEAAGAEALTMRAVASEVGVTHAAPYRHFANKSKLLEAVVDDGFFLLHRTVLDNRGADLVAMGATYLRFATDRRHLFELMTRSAGARSIRRELTSLAKEISNRSHIDSQRAQIVVAAWHGMACMEHDPADVELLARLAQS